MKMGCNISVSKGGGVEMFMQQLTGDPYDHKGFNEEGGFLFCDTYRSHLCRFFLFHWN